mmetsp:Transcript_19826/g.26152  ORF Transcript_19826/g.26152 Transcript_19826/m.26152 type:complete len:510 (-) Transcript_19826:397-1926(-)
MEVLEEMDQHYSVRYPVVVDFTESQVISTTCQSNLFQGIEFLENGKHCFRLNLVPAEDGSMVWPYIEIVHPKDREDTVCLEHWPLLMDVKFFGMGQDTPFIDVHNLLFTCQNKENQDQMQLAGKKAFNFEELKKLNAIDETTGSFTVEVELSLPSSVMYMLILRSWVQMQLPSPAISSSFFLLKYLKDIGINEGLITRKNFFHTVQEPILSYISQCFEDIQDHPELSLCDEESFGLILSAHNLKVKNEYQALEAVKKWCKLSFEAVMEWGKEQGKTKSDMRSESSPKASDDATGDEMDLQSDEKEAAEVLATQFEVSSEHQKLDFPAPTKEDGPLAFVPESELKATFKGKGNQVGRVKWIKDIKQGFFMRKLVPQCCITLKKEDIIVDARSLHFYRDPSKILPLLRFPFIPLHKLKQDLKFWAVLKALPVGISLVGEAFSVQVDSGSMSGRSTKRKLKMVTHPTALSLAPDQLPSTGKDTPNQARKKARAEYSEALIPAYQDEDIMHII